jgi:hypothetical protein
VTDDILLFAQVMAFAALDELSRALQLAPALGGNARGASQLNFLDRMPLN